MTAPASKDAFAGELTTLRHRILLMGGRVEDMISRSVQALVEGDRDLARQTMQLDAGVDRDEVEIDELCLGLLERRAPHDRDLRFVAFSLKMVTDLERVGDLAVNICERALDLPADGAGSAHVDLAAMAIIAQEMLRDAIDAFVRDDEVAARRVIERDDEVDELCHRIFRDQLEQARLYASDTERCIGLQSVARHLERIADHATNIAEEVIFMVRGKDVRHANGRAAGG